MVIVLPCLMLVVFEKALKAKQFTDIWKNANVAPVHKKEENDLFKKLLSNCLTPSKSTHICPFTMNSTSKIHLGSSSRFHRFWKANPRENYDINSR